MLLKIHGIRTSFQWSGCWRKLENSLNIFHPLNWHLKKEATLTWSEDIDTDILASQLMLIALVVQFEKNLDQEWPWFVKHLGSNILRNPSLLDGWKISSWTSDDYVLPWRKLLPDSTFKLVAVVVLKVLIFWSNTLKTIDVQLAVKLLKEVLAAYDHWIQVSKLSIDTLSISTNPDSDSHPAGKLFKFSSLGELNRDVKQIIQTMPLRALKQFQQSSDFWSLDSDFQAAIRKRSG